MSNHLKSRIFLPNVPKPCMAIIGSDFAELSGEAYLVGLAYRIDIYEKNTKTGFRANQLIAAKRYIFDMRPGGYELPGVFKKSFHDLRYKLSFFYNSEPFEAGFMVVFRQQNSINISADYSALNKFFEALEPGSARRLGLFLTPASYRYTAWMDKLVQKTGILLTEFTGLDLVRDVKLLAYICCPPKADDMIVPEKHRNLFLLIFWASGPKNSEQLQKIYFNLITDCPEEYTDMEIRNSPGNKKEYGINDLQTEHKSFRDNAYGLTNTWMPTAYFKLSKKNKKLKSLFYTDSLLYPDLMYNYRSDTAIYLPSNLSNT